MNTNTTKEIDSNDYVNLPYCLTKIAKNRFVLFDRSYEQLLPKPESNHNYRRTTCYNANLDDLEYSFEIIPCKHFESLYRKSPNFNLYFLYNAETFFNYNCSKTKYIQDILQKYKLPILSIDYFH